MYKPNFKSLILFLFMFIFFLAFSTELNCEIPIFTLQHIFYHQTGIAIGDIDGDCDYDVLMIFERTHPQGIGDRCLIYINDGNANLLFSGQDFGPLTRGRVYMGDFDRDGDLDAIVTSPRKVYFNYGDGSFIPSSNIIDPPLGGNLYYIAIGDLDNDGDLDFIHNEQNNYLQQIYLNDGNGNFTKGQYFGLPYSLGVDIADVDNDGDLDYATTMNGGPTKICFNNGNATFSESIYLGDPLTKHCKPRFADFNGDGRIDLVEGSQDDRDRGNRIYFNMGNHIFIDSGQRVGAHNTLSIAVCDIDNDGDIDIIESGGIVYLNDGTGFFTMTPFPSGGSNMIEIGDLDCDSDLDMFSTNFFLNNISNYHINTPPTAPSNISYSIDQNNITLNWEEGSDQQTVPALLTYNLRIGTNPGGFDVFQAEIGPEYTTPSFGNCWHVLKKTLNLPDGVYFWSVQTVDSGFMRSPWYPEQTFYVGIKEVKIDIKPGSFPNSINLGSNGNVPVAIFSATNFSAIDVNPISITLAGATVKLKGKGTPISSAEDVNGDGVVDLIVHVDTSALQLSQGDTEAILEGVTYNGQRIRGVDTIRVVNE